MIRVTDKEAKYVSSAVEEKQDQKVTSRKWRTPKRCLTTVISLRSDVYIVSHGIGDFDQVLIQWRDKSREDVELDLNNPAGKIDWSKNGKA